MDPIDQDHIELKQETIHEDHNTTGMKEEPNQDPEYGSNEASGSSDQQIQSGELMDPIDQDQIELKQETIHEDHNTTGMKEEQDQDPSTEQRGLGFQRSAGVSVLLLSGLIVCAERPADASMKMVQDVEGVRGSDEDYDDITNVTTEHEF
ncbi:hypothetical protein Q5P01_002977 [Channa striata]|uniref:Uncharacterized protein n=1 Tax=Channa striata TaxID=64152 RepID=A0AA88NSK4_CHASR|nr:hypothetical protein Q5P01_002977 [Channa striata]